MAKDVELVIRAKDAATKAIDSIKDALKDLTGVQEDVGKSASKTDSLLGDLGRQLGALVSEAKGLSALGKVASEIDRAGKAVSNLEGDVRKSAQEFAKLARESEIAKRTADQLRGQLDAERKALKDNSAERKVASDQLRAANKEVERAERAQEALNRAIEKAPVQRQTKGVGVEAGAPQTSAVASAGVFTQAALTAAKNEQAQLTAIVASFNAEIQRSKQAISDFQTQIGVAAEQERKLSRETEKAATSVAKGREDLSKSRSVLQEISTVADKATTVFGDLAKSEDKIAEASARMAAEIARTKAQIDTLSAAKPATAVTGDRRAALESRRDFLAAQAEVKRLAEEMRAAQSPTVEMGAALGRAQANARLAAQAYDENRAATARLKNEQGSLSAFLQRTATEQQKSANAFVQSQAAMARGNQQVATAAASTTAALAPIAPAARAASDGLQSASVGGNNFRNALTSIYGEGRQTLSFMQRLRSEVLSLVSAYIGLYGAAQQISNILGAFRTLEGAQSRLGVAFAGDTGKVGKELQFITVQAQRLGVSFGDLSDQYSKFAIAASAANFSADATRKVFLSVAEAGRVNKLSTEQLNGVFLALTQMISKGKVSAEELRGQLGERLAGAFNIFADAVGVSTAELDKMLQHGEVIANQGTLLKFADQLDKRFGPQLTESLRGTTAELGRFQDNIFQAQLRIAQGGFIDGFTDALRKLNEYFQSRDGRDFFLSIGAALGNFATALATVPKYFNEIATAITILIGLKLGSYLTTVATSLVASTRSIASANAGMFTWAGTVTAVNGRLAALSGTIATTSTSIAALTARTAAATSGLSIIRTGLLGLQAVTGVVAGAFRLLWTAIGGLPGVIMTGVALAIGSWVTRISDATSALDEHKRQMDIVLAKYDEAKGKAVDWAAGVRGVTVSQAEDNLGKLVDSYNQKFDQLNSKAAAVRNILSAFNNGPASRRGMAGAGNLADLQKLIDALDSLGKKQTTIEQFKKTLDEVARSTKNANLKTLAVDLQNTITAADDKGASFADLADAVGKAEARLRLLKGEATEADKALLGLKSSAAGSFDKQIIADAKAFSEALTEINKLVPSISDEMKRLSEIEALDKQYKSALNLARTMGQVNAATEAYNAALKGINDNYNSRAINNDVSGSGNLVDKIVGIESSGDPNAKNPKSTATGLGQFIEKTWIDLFKKYFPDRAESMSREAVLELRKSEKISRDMIALYAKENADVLQSAGVAVNQAALYLAHFLGPQGAVKVLQAPKGTKTEDVLGADQINANKSILQGKTTEEVVKWAERKVGLSKEEVTLQKDVAELQSKQAEKAKTYNDDLETRLKLKADENANEGRLSKEGFVQQQLAEEQKKARAAEVTLTDEQIQRIKELAAKEWEITNAKREGKTAQQEANTATTEAAALAAQRVELQKQFNLAQKGGDSDAAAALQTRLTETNAKLQEAIEKARQMWTAIGGPEADAALVKLDTLKLKADASTNSVNLLGLSSKQIGDLAGRFADGLVGAFDEFAKAVANGENALQALGKAFLKFAAEFLLEIAKMILKQQILNMLQSFSKAFNLGLPIPGVASAHTGGVVGSGLVGMGNMRRSVDPSIFAGAIRYHTGGVAGLRPDEVPTILRKGEEVLTQDDPRHRQNGGAAGQPSSGPAASIRNILVLDEESATKWLGGSAGEQVTIGHIKNNSATIKRLLG